MFSGDTAVNQTIVMHKASIQKIQARRQQINSDNRNKGNTMIAK